ncbi:MAG TPA: hypothetical protein VGY99_00400 [Candidatus Binataceae bacterium]|jgi:hypothetical protein|nr:hypothetical protein [Candidatus Binataceae bacterium]
MNDADEQPGRPGRVDLGYPCAIALTLFALADLAARWLLMR